MKPNEYWNSTYREINIYIQANLANVMDEFIHSINLQEAVTDKLIMADAMSNRNPKILSLHKTFANLFPEQEEKIETPNEILNKMRTIMKKEP